MKLSVLYLFSMLLLAFSSCTPARQLNRTTRKTLLRNPAFKTAHLGISIYDAAAGKYLYNYQGDKYFVPASNTKVATCYAALKYLGDSLVGLRYEREENHVVITGTGDPTFLHPDFKHQPVLQFLQAAGQVHYPVNELAVQLAPFGRGWTFDDYLSSYAPERSEMPIYGNVASFDIQGDTVAVSPGRFYNHSVQWLNQTLKNGVGPYFTITRPFENNGFYSRSSNAIYQAKTKFSKQQVPFKTILPEPGSFYGRTFIRLLEDTLHRQILPAHYLHQVPVYRNVVYSQPTDSLLKLMMHRSDNFFAEQALLMTSNEQLQVMDEASIIDTLLKTDLKNLPQPPRWVDGSGLSRYNLFTPQDLVTILDKMQKKFGMKRLEVIFPTGNEGTLAGYYIKDSGYLFAKTGTLSGVVALSGYMYTAKKQLLIFSVLVNNHQHTATGVRRAVEDFVQRVRSKM